MKGALNCGAPVNPVSAKLHLVQDMYSNIDLGQDLDMGTMWHSWEVAQTRKWCLDHCVVCSALWPTLHCMQYSQTLSHIRDQSKDWTCTALLFSDRHVCCSHQQEDAW